MWILANKTQTAFISIGLDSRTVTTMRDWASKFKTKKDALFTKSLLKYSHINSRNFSPVKVA